MSGWLSAVPQILLAVAVLGVPGWVVAVSLRFRPWDALALGVPLSLGVLAVANEVSLHAHVRWGLPVIAATTVVLAAVCAGSMLLTGLQRGSEPTAGGDAVDGAVWSVRHHQLAVVATFGAAVVGAIAVARGIGSPSSLNQTYDGVFHVNSINAVAQHHLASPGLFGGLKDGSTHGAFYPPTFAAVAGLLTIYAGVNPINAANITALAIAVLWPLAASIAVRRLARPTAWGYAVAMAGAVTVALFPALLLRFGTLWPNALSYLALAPALVVMVRLVGLDETEGAADAQGRLPWWPTLIVAVISIPGLIFAHPGAAYLLFYLAVPVLLWFGWRRFVMHGAEDPRTKALRGIAVTAVVGLAFVGLVWASYRVSAIASVRHQYWPPKETWDESVGHVLLLGTRLNPPNAAMAVLALLGLWLALRWARGRLLIAWYLIIAVLAILSAGIETPSTMRWTGFWYNDPFRLFAALPLVVLPLIAIGADELTGRLRGWLGDVVDAGVVPLPRWLRTGVAAAVVLSLGVLAFQGGLGTRKVSSTVAASYADAPHPIVNAGEEAMLKRLAPLVPVGKTIAGDPFTGEILAGVLSGHPVVYPAFGRPIEPDRALVAARFSEYRTDRSVCAAVKRLRIGVVIDGPHFIMETPAQLTRFSGFANFGSIPGLTAIAAGGGAVAYRVGPCAS